MFWSHSCHYSAAAAAGGYKHCNLLAFKFYILLSFAKQKYRIKDKPSVADSCILESTFLSILTPRWSLINRRKHKARIFSCRSSGLCGHWHNPGKASWASEATVSLERRKKLCIHSVSSSCILLLGSVGALFETCSSLPFPLVRWRGDHLLSLAEVVFLCSSSPLLTFVKSHICSQDRAPTF